MSEGQELNSTGRGPSALGTTPSLLHSLGSQPLVRYLVWLSRAPWPLLASTTPDLSGTSSLLPAWLRSRL